MAALLEVIAATGIHAKDPRVDHIWGSCDTGEASTLTVSLSEFLDTLASNAEALRTTSILQMCSAFENALCGYFYLCCLYQPLKEDSTYTGDAVPQLLKNAAAFEARKAALKLRCNAALHGKYSKRVGVLVSTWSLPALPRSVLTKLNAYYSKRHLIAHDQSIDSADDPDSSAIEIIGRRLAIDEATWKSMIADFDSVLSTIDIHVQKLVVVDRGVHLAVHKIVDRDGPQTDSELKGKIQNEWRTGSLKSAIVLSAARAIGMNTRQLANQTLQIYR
ncbi:MAG: hypothetical protein WC023_12345 [Rhodocyclaceae bacterium]